MALRALKNDVVIMRGLLVKKFGFSDDRIVTLAEKVGREERKPTRKNIEREFRRLANVVKKGDQVVILLAGHGSQQPDDDPENPEDFEPDGLDEIFLPSDVGDWDGGKGRVTNAICDDELRTWLDDIRKKGAFIWVIVDACHSGTMVRGASKDRGPTGQASLVEDPCRTDPESAGNGPGVARARVQATESHFEALDLPKEKGGIVAIYAAQATEPTVESRTATGCRLR